MDSDGHTVADYGHQFLGSREVAPEKCRKFVAVGVAQVDAVFGVIVKSLSESLGQEVTEGRTVSLDFKSLCQFLGQFESDDLSGCGSPHGSNLAFRCVQ